VKLTKALMALFVLTVVSVGAAADSQWSQVSWFTAESVAHSISYGVYNASLACSQTALYYVEPAPIDGDETKLNATTDSTGSYLCQNDSQGAIVVNNDGSVGINVTAAFNQITSGVSMKIATANAGWEGTCSGTCDAGSCDLSANCLALSTGDVQIAYNLAQNASQEYYLWADFNNVVGTVAPTKGNMTTTAVKYTA
jgi:hypothetical protein